MPNVTKTEKRKGKKGKAEYMEKCLHTLKKEGKPHQTAVAQCINMWEEDWHKKGTKGSTEPDWDRDHEIKTAIGTMIYLPN